MKKALIITYYWPPGSGPGVQRWLKFCKYLSEYEWEPIVITVKNGSYPNVDHSLHKDVGASTSVFKTKTREPFAVYNFLRGKQGKTVEVSDTLKSDPKGFEKLAIYIRSNFFIPDARKGWNQFAYQQAKEIIKKEKPDLVVTTGPPHSTHLVGLQLQKEFGIRWVADFRDPWTTVYYNQHLIRSNASIIKDKSLEDEVVSSADMVVTTSPGITQELKERAKEIVTIPNGFDDTDFQDLSPTTYEKFTLAYVGNFKANQNVTGLWKTLAMLKEARQISNKNFQLRVTGNVHDSVVSSWTAHGIEELIVQEQFVPHHEAIQHMQNAHLLLLPVPMDENNQSILTGKIFEYLATQRPILAIGPEDGNAATVLAECGKDPMVSYNNISGIAAYFLKYLSLYRVDSDPAQIGNDNHLRYSRKGCTERLIAEFNALCA